MKTDTLVSHLLLLAACILALWPIIFMIGSSFKSLDDIFQTTLNPFPLSVTLANYKIIWQRFPVLQFMGNTLYIACLVTLSKVVTSVITGFAFVYFRFRGRELLFNSMLLTFFIPITVLIMPNYLLMSHLGLLNTPYGVILPELVDGMGIFLVRQTLRSIPRGLFEAAALEGAGLRYTLTHVVLPLIRPITISIAILFFINSWNEYFWPVLILQDQSHFTLPLAMQLFISAEGGSEWNLAMTIASLASLPPLILYGIGQKFIMNTFMQSGVKG